MNRLFIELYLDEGVSVLIADLLRARGFIAVTTRESGQTGQNDAAQPEYAASQHKSLLTHNRADFEALARQYFSLGRTHSGIIIPVRRSPYEILRRLLIILNQVTADENVRNSLITKMSEVKSSSFSLCLAEIQQTKV